MSKKDLPLIIAGVGILYLLTRSRSSFVGPAYGGSQPVVPGVGSFVSGFSNFLSSLFGGHYDTGVPVSTTSNPGINPVTNPSAYPSGGGTPGPYDSGDVCDRSSVQFNENVCTDMGGSVY
jgi:hypothetical protein